MPQPVGEYRGCTILMYGEDLYGNSCTAGLRFTIARVKQDIDAYRDRVPEEPEPEPEPEPDQKVFVETYRGVDVFYDSAVFRYWFEFESVAYGPATLNEAHTWIDTLLEPEPEPEEYWEYHSTYRGILIYIWMPSGAFYQAIFGGETHNATSLSTLHAEIDAFLGPEGWKFIEIYRGLAIYLWQTQDEWYGYWTASGGVQYGPFTTVQACRDKIDELVEPTGIPTNITISAPGSVEEGQVFNVSGVLYETGTQHGVPNQTISLSYNGVNLGSATTASDGRYQKNVSILSTGVYTLNAYYAGTTTFGASESTIKIGTGALSDMIVPLLALGLGIALIYASKRI